MTDGPANPLQKQSSTPKMKLTHVSSTGNAHMVSISDKSPTKRTATAICSIYFSNAASVMLIRENRAKKGDVLGVARIAGIMAAKQTSALIPLCHPISITHVSVEVEIADVVDGKNIGDGTFEEATSQIQPEKKSIPWAGTGQGDAYKWSESWKPTSGTDKAGLVDKSKSFGRIDISATVSCDGKTGVEMEALTAASTAALTVYDMCKAVDKGMRIEALRVVRKEGGKSGTWVEGEAQS